MILGIDASNLRAGGGVTHLQNLMKLAKPEDHGIKKIIVWGGKNTLDQLQGSSIIELREVPRLDQNLGRRLVWQNLKLTSLAKKDCDLLFVPGSLYLGTFRPFVTMCRNLLPFKEKELARYGISARFIRMKLLNIGQTKTFINSNGVIFLTQYTRDLLLTNHSSLQNVKNTVIAHGINPDYWKTSKVKRREMESILIVYVSTIDYYKHQCNVARATTLLKKEGFNIKLQFVGSAYPAALKKLELTLNQVDPNRTFISYLGEYTQKKLSSLLFKSDIFIFASSCETFGISLLEGMAAQLPVACSDIPPMSEILGDAGIYFNPENVESIANKLRILINSAELRDKLAKKARKRAETFSWEKCALSTFDFITDCYDSYKE